jgi:hypothetical protein
MGLYCVGYFGISLPIVLFVSSSWKPDVNYLRVFDDAVKPERPSNANNKLVSLSRHKPHKPITTELACIGLLNEIARRPRHAHIVHMVVIWLKTLSSV